MFADEALVGVLVRLSDPGHGDLRGRWFIEWGVGAWDLRSAAPHFADLADAEQWFRDRLAG
jgi:hypothetical protein